MARCDAGYFCSRCGEYVTDLASSGLYLRFIIGEVGFLDLFRAPEVHIRCDPALAGFIDDAEFAGLDGELEAPEAALDEEARAARRRLVTRGYRRLLALPEEGANIPDYPLPEFRARVADEIRRWQASAG